MKLTRILQSAMALTATAMVAVSCQKNSETPASSLQLPNQVAAVSGIVTTDTIYGNWGYPATPSTYGTIKVQLGGTDSIALTSFNNSFVQASGSYQLYYLRTTTIAFSALSTSDFVNPPGAPSSSIGLNTGGTTPNGWYNYNPSSPGNPLLVSNFYIAAVNTSPLGGTNYAFYFRYAGGDGTGSPNRGKYIITKGVLNP